MPRAREPNAVAIGDIDGDGKPDLVVADGEGLSLLLQSASVPGTFLQRTRIGLGHPGSGHARQLR